MELYVKFGVLQTEPRETFKLPFHLFVCLVMMARCSFPGTAKVAGPEPHKERKERAKHKIAVGIPRHPAETCLRAGPPIAHGINKRHGTGSACVKTKRASHIKTFAALKNGV